MRTFVLAASLLATLGAHAVAAHDRHHAAMPKHAAEFVDVVPSDASVTDFGVHVDRTSPILNANPHPCIWGIACTY